MSKKNQLNKQFTDLLLYNVVFNVYLLIFVTLAKNVSFFEDSCCSAAVYCDLLFCRVRYYWQTCFFFIKKKRSDEIISKAEMSTPNKL